MQFLYWKEWEREAPQSVRALARSRRQATERVSASAAGGPTARGKRAGTP